MPLPEPGDRVITPTDEVARVLEVGPGGTLELSYRDALVADHARLTLRASLCAVWEFDKPRPRPVRRVV